MTTQSPQSTVPHGQTYAPAVPMSRATQPLSIWGFVLSLLFWPAGLVLSILAIKKIGREGGGGRGLAIAGVVISSCAAVFGVILLFATMAGVAATSAATGAAPAAVGPVEPAAEGEGSAVPAPGGEQPAAPQEPAVVVSAQELIAVLEGNALAAKNTYEGKRVTVTGFVGNIDASGDYFAVDPEPDAFILTGVQVQTSEEFLDQVAGFTAGQPVTVTGTVTSVGEILGYSIDAEVIAP